MSILGFFGIADRDPTSGFWYGPVGRRTVAGVDVNENTALNYSACWAGTRVLCATGSCLPLDLMRRTGDRSKEVAADHDVHRVIHHQFNPEMGAMIARSFGINMQVNRGNFYAEIVWKRGQKGTGLKELWPIHESRVEVRRFDGGELGYRVRNEDGSTDDFQRDEIFHVPSIISSNGITGKGVIQNARESIGSSIGAERHGASYFGNGAMPGIIIKGGKFKTKEDREDYRRQWMEVHGGPSNAMKPALLPEGADVAFMTFNARDSQFLEIREHNINEFARWYGVPPHMLYDLRRATFTNIEAQGIEFVVYSLVPWLKLWEQEIWRKLLTEEEQKTYFAKHRIEGLLRGDSAARAAFYKALFEIGVFTINDILELEDRNAISEEDGGDKHFVPLNMTTADKAGEIEDEPPLLIGPVDDEEEDVPDAALISTELVAAHDFMQAPVLSDDSQTIAAKCREAVSGTLGRMLNKECRACRTAAENNQPAKFFAWLDDYYDRYGATLAEAMRSQVEILLLTAGDPRSSAEVIAAAASKHVAESKESVLRATEVPADQWASVPERITACGATWQANRTDISKLGV